MKLERILPDSVVWRQRAVLPVAQPECLNKRLVEFSLVVSRSNNELDGAKRTLSWNEKIDIAARSEGWIAVEFRGKGEAFEGYNRYLGGREQSQQINSFAG